MPDKIGLSAAVDAARQAAIADLVESGQVAEPPLLPEVFEPEAPIEAEGPRGPGRPPGALNRSTIEWTDFILGRYKSPLVFLAETYARDAKELVAAGLVKASDVLRLQVEAASKLAPYLHQKQPMAVQVDAAGHVTLVIVEGSPAPAGGDETLVIEGELLDSEDHAKSET